MTNSILTSDPPQHLVGGLDVALVVAQESSSEQVQQTKTALEELGVNVLVLGLSLGALPMAGGNGREQVQVSQSLAAADPDSFDGVLVLAGPQGARRLASSEEARRFLKRMDAENKPIGAISEGLLPLLVHGLVRERSVSAPPHLTGELENHGAVPATAEVTVDSNVVSMREREGLDSFNTALKNLLARRRMATLTIGNDVPSAVGEDG